MITNIIYICELTRIERVSYNLRQATSETMLFDIIRIRCKSPALKPPYREHGSLFTGNLAITIRFQE